MAGLSSDDLVSSFLTVVNGETAATARRHLEATSWKLEEAINLYYNGGIHTLPESNRHMGDSSWTAISKSLKCSVFLDIDSVEIVGDQIDTLYQSIEAALKNHNKDLVIAGRIYCYGRDGNKLDIVYGLKNCLVKNNVAFKVHQFRPRLPTHSACRPRVEPLERKRELCQIELSKDIGSVAVKNYNHILIISSDKEFIRYYNELKIRRLRLDENDSRIYLATDRPIIGGDNHVWQWANMKAGGYPGGPPP